MPDGWYALRSHVLDCAKQLEQFDPNSAPLRRLQRALLALQPCDTAEVQAVANVLEWWIRDYYYNFAGDIVSPQWEKVEEIRNQLLRDTVSFSFRKIASGNAWEGLIDLVVGYKRAVDDANKVVAQG